MKRFVAALVVGIIPFAFVAPARADNCQSTVVGSVCLPSLPLPGLPQIPGLPPVAPTLPVPAPAPIPAPVIPPAIPAHPQAVPVPVPNSPAPVTVNPPPVVKSNPVQTQTAPNQAPQPDKTETKATTPEAPGATKTITKTKTRVITVAQAVGLSIGALFLGGFLALLGMYVTYRIGKREGENGVNEFMSDLLGRAVRSERKT